MSYTPEDKRRYFLLVVLIIVNITIEYSLSRFAYIIDIKKQNSVYGEEQLTKPSPEEQLENIASYIRNKFPRYEDMDNEKAVKSFLFNHPDIIEHIPTDVGKIVLPEIFYTPGERLYKELGYRGPGFWGRVGYQFKNIAVSMYGTVPGLIGFDATTKKAEKEMLKIAEEPNIQAYLEWRKEEPVTSNNWLRPGLVSRYTSETLPAVILMFLIFLAVLWKVSAPATLTSDSTLFTRLSKGTILVLSIFPIAFILGVSKLIIPISAIGGLLRAGLAVGIFYYVLKIVSRLNLSTPKFLIPLLEKVRNLPTGWYRLSLILWFVFPAVLFIMIGSLEEATAAALYVFIFYWPLLFLTLWVVEGFRQK
jgi:hypothetical protein